MPVAAVERERHAGSSDVESRAANRARAERAGQPLSKLVCVTGPLDAARSVVEAESQQLRGESLQVQSRALKLFEQGDTDQAVQLLSDLATKVKASKLTAARQKVILEPIEQKLDNFRLIKRQVDLYTKDAKEKKERVETRLAKTTAEQQKQEEIAKRVRTIKELMEKKQFGEAEKLALQTKQLDPDSEQIALIHQLAKNNRRVEEARQLKADREEFALDGLNRAEAVGPALRGDDPIAVNLMRSRQNAHRPGGDDVYTRPRTAVEREIELKLEKPLTLELKSATLREVIDKFADLAQVTLSRTLPAISLALSNAAARRLRASPTFSPATSAVAAIKARASSASWPMSLLIACVALLCSYLFCFC